MKEAAVTRGLGGRRPQDPGEVGVWNRSRQYPDKSGGWKKQKEVWLWISWRLEQKQTKPRDHELGRKEKEDSTVLEKLVTGAPYGWSSRLEQTSALSEGDDPPFSPALKVCGTADLLVTSRPSPSTKVSCGTPPPPVVVVVYQNLNVSCFAT